jgi:hypothetical protein
MVHSDRFGAFGLLALLGFLVLGALGVWTVGLAQEVIDLRQANAANATKLAKAEEQLNDIRDENAWLADQFATLNRENESLRAQVHARDRQLTLTALERDAWQITARGAFTWERVWLPLALVAGLGLSVVVAWRMPLVEQWPLWAWLSGLLRRLGRSV